MARKASADVNVSEEIRKYIISHPEVGPTGVAEGLKKIGIATTPGYVSTIKNLAKKKRGGGKSGRGKSSGDISFSTLVQVKKFAQQVGGVEKAKQALDALCQLAD